MRPPDARLPAMISLYRDGKSLEDVGRAFAVSKQRIYQIFQKAGVVLRTKSIASDYAIHRDHGIGEPVAHQDKLALGGRAPSQFDTKWRAGHGHAQAGRAGKTTRW